MKAKGRLKILAEKTNDGKAVIGSCGIGHTRWATHGEPSENNAHPHRSDDGNVVAVHNGIIENYQELKEKLVRKGYAFYSDTDTEVAVKLVDDYYKKYEGTPVDAINHAMVRIRGSYALAVMFNEYPEEIYVARKDSPMILGIEDGESYIASDIPAILKYTRNVYYIGNMEMARVRKVLNRELWFNPLNKILGGWGLYENGQLTTESIENILLFIPFSVLFLWAFHKELLGSMDNFRFGKTIWAITKIVAVFSFIIEFSQLLFHLGTFQISDLCYNTLGGTIGGVIYFIGHKFKKRKKNLK